MPHKSHKKFSPRTPEALLPSQVAAAYGFPTDLDLSSRSVAIVELGGAFQLSDVIAYCKRFNFKVPQISTYVLPGATETSDPNGADGEVCLDIDIVAAVAAGCHIKVIFAPNTDSGPVDGFTKAISLNPDSISFSWGSPEADWSPESRSAIDALFQEAGNKGIAVYCASGDNGSSDGASGDKNCDYPASSPYAIACGGTHLELNADGTRLTETAWSTTGLDVLGNIVGSSEGSGGGISAVYTTTPNWQEAALPGSNAGRRSPDVSGNADPSTGYQVDIDGTIQQIGGTSAVAPLFAALQAILNQSKGAHVGNMHTKLYSAPAGTFFDVISGTNGAYKCEPGYDCVTGLGVLDATRFLATLAATSPAPTTGEIPSSDAVKLFQAACRAEAGVEVDYEYLVRFLSSPHHPELKASAVDLSWWTTAMKVANTICEISKIACPIVQSLPTAIEPKQ
jgi:kumamolisin